MLMKTSEALDEVVRHEGAVEDLLQKKMEIESLREDMEALATAVGSLKQLRKEEDQCQEAVKHAGEVTRLIELDNEINEDIAEHNELQGMIEKWNGLNNELQDAETKLANLELEFREAMPEACPIFDVPCEHIKEAKK